MSFHKALDRLHKHKTYTEWKKVHPHHYLAHGFQMRGGGADHWQIGFYDKDTDRITVFELAEEITAQPPSQIFKETGLVKELNHETVALDEEEAVAIADKYRAVNYPNHNPLRTMILVQHLERGQIWNITFVTNSFAVCNIKIDAATGEVVAASCDSLISWSGKDKK